MAGTRCPRGGSQPDVAQALRYALAVHAGVDRRMPEAVALAEWINRSRLNISVSAPVHGDMSACGSQRSPVAASTWARIARALRTALDQEDADPRIVSTGWVKGLAAALGLDALEGGILALCINYQHNDRVENLFDAMCGVRAPSHRLVADAGVIGLLLGAEPVEVRRLLLPEARLQASGLLQVDGDGGISVLARLMRLIARGLSAEGDLVERLLGGIRQPLLPWEAFAHLGPEAELAAKVLTEATARREEGIGILLYGPPGTGKTSFSAALAARAGAKLRPVGEADEVGGEPSRSQRLADLRLAQQLAGPGSVLLFDEAEDLFAASGWTNRGAPMRGSRVYLHRLLERGRLPVIWTANDISEIGPAVLRRMTLCLELRLPETAKRAQLWRSMAEEAGVLLTEADAAALSRMVPAAPAVASTALRAARLAGGGADAARLAVAGLARAIGGGRLPMPEPEVADYDVALINADTDLAALAGRLTAADAPRAVSLLLSGPPGSGKSAFVRYLAARMGMPLLQKRASDLLDKYVGGTEHNIAGAFAEARDAGAFLVFDEADSLLQDRAGAARGWEVTQVNEMLTWMESHKLPFACTTNLVDRLDTASLRRFLVKARFGWLRPDQARRAFAQSFGCAVPAGLAALRTLTPADFALVRRRAGLAGADGDADALLRLLRAECEGRSGERGPLGFVAGNPA